MRDKAGLVYIYKKNRKVGVIQKDLIMYVNYTYRYAYY